VSLFNPQEISFLKSKYKYRTSKSSQFRRTLHWVLSAASACLPACLPACLINKKKYKQQNTCTFTVKAKSKQKSKHVHVHGKREDKKNFVMPGF
jgi:hypothetical protein